MPHHSGRYCMFHRAISTLHENGRSVRLPPIVPTSPPKVASPRSPWPSPTTTRRNLVTSWGSSLTAAHHFRGGVTGKGAGEGRASDPSVIPFIDGGMGDFSAAMEPYGDPVIKIEYTSIWNNFRFPLITIPPRMKLLPFAFYYEANITARVRPCNKTIDNQQLYYPYPQHIFQY